MGLGSTLQLRHDSLWLRRPFLSGGDFRTNHQRGLDSLNGLGDSECARFASWSG